MKKVFLTGIAIIASGVIAAACSGGGGGGTSSFILDDGTYDYTIANVPADTCWPLQDTIPPTGFVLPFLITVNSETSFTLTGSGVAAGIVPPIAGTKTANDIAANGSLLYAVSNSCSIMITAVADGLMTADSVFDADIALNLDANVLTSSGRQSNCRNVSTLGGVLPNPALIRSNGECDLTISGTAVLGS